MRTRAGSADRARSASCASRVALAGLAPRAGASVRRRGRRSTRACCSTGIADGARPRHGARPLGVGAHAADERAGAPAPERRPRRRPRDRRRALSLLERRRRARAADRRRDPRPARVLRRSAASCSSTTPPPGITASRAPFGRSARREIARVLPDSAPITIGTDHVVFRTFYLLRRAEGRVEGPASLDAIVRGGQAQVLFSEHDLGGALARGASGMWEQPVVPGRRAAARARHPPRGEHRDVRPLLELQGRSGPRAVPHARARALTSP